jgi:hypothetical protein
MTFGLTAIRITIIINNCNVHFYFLDHKNMIEKEDAHRTVLAILSTWKKHNLKRRLEHVW